MVRLRPIAGRIGAGAGLLLGLGGAVALEVGVGRGRNDTTAVYVGMSDVCTQPLAGEAAAAAIC